ncbi:MAG: hypothetical protein ACR2IE_02765 [Candidatus Sumerlaeaceae bacterium]
MPTFLETLKRAASEPGYLKTLLFGAAVVPANPAPDAFDDTAPSGLKLLHVAPTTAEADLMRQVLAEAGFEIQYVAASSTGVFGTSGNRSIHVREDQFEDANQFLTEYLAAEPIEEE